MTKDGGDDGGDDSDDDDEDDDDDDNGDNDDELAPTCGDKDHAKKVAAGPVCCLRGQSACSGLHARWPSRLAFGDRSNLRYESASTVDLK